MGVQVLVVCVVLLQCLVQAAVGQDYYNLPNQNLFPGTPNYQSDLDWQNHVQASSYLYQAIGSAVGGLGFGLLMFFIYYCRKSRRDARFARLREMEPSQQEADDIIAAVTGTGGNATGASQPPLSQQEADDILAGITGVPASKPFRTDPIHRMPLLESEVQIAQPVNPTHTATVYTNPDTGKEGETNASEL